MTSHSSRKATSTRSQPTSTSASITTATNSRTPTTTTNRPPTTRSRPRTNATTTSSSGRNEIICAVSEGRGVSPSIGLSFVNLSTCEAVLCQFADTQTYARTCHKIAVFDPTEILVSDTTVESKLVAVVQDNLVRGAGAADSDRSGAGAGLNITPLNRKYWSEGAGFDYLRQLALPEDWIALELALVGKFYAVCCFAAVLQYVDLGLGKVFAPQTLRVTFESSEGAMMIDTSTIASLELVHNLQNAKSKDCLFGLMDQTLTKMGTRVLRSNILQPSTDREKILKRYAAVKELSSKEGMFFAVRDALEGFVDADRALAALVLVQKRIDFTYMESSVNNVLMLKSFVDAIMPIFRALTGAESEELQHIRELCRFENYIEIQQLIEYALNDGVHYSSKAEDLRYQRVYAIKAGVNGFLDVARQTYKEIRGDIEEMWDELNEQYRVNLQLKYDPARSYYFRIKAAEMEDRELPEQFINVFRKKGLVECQTLDLVKMNQRLRDAHAEVISLSDSSIQHLIEAVRTKIHPLFKISEGIALLDMLTAFAHLVTTQEYVQPELLEDTLAIQALRHPIRDKIQRDKLIPNDVYATPQKRFQIITGCNMSGKSTYIRSIALTAVMAQMGCFVPAVYASTPLMHQLFARVSTDDSIEANVSTFASEMREMAFILRTLEPRSLIIIDELGRGTSTTDGLAIAIAISEALIESKAFVWFVTHFRDLPRILSERAGVVSFHLTVEIAPDFSRMKMMYKIAPGNEEQKFYGLAIAKVVDLPPQVYADAAEMSQYLNERNEARKTNAKTLAVARKRKLVLALKEQLMQARESELDNEALREFLQQLQEEFVIRMAAIEAKVSIAEGAPGSPPTDDFEMEDYQAGGHAGDPIEVSSEDASSSVTTPASLSSMGEISTPVSVAQRYIKKEPVSYEGELSDDMIEDF